jgi:hypothetical protein
VGGVHTPPLQVSAFVRSVPPQKAATHTVPLGYVEHAPDPLQPPDSPQLAAPMFEQFACGSEPSFTGPHTPSAPWPFAAAEQA